MENKDLAIAVEAVNKWLFFGWNFQMTSHEWFGIGGEQHVAYVPTFLKEVDWNCCFDHIYSKWIDITENNEPDAYLVRFYAEIGAIGRRRLIEWVMNNYNGEQKI